MNIGRRLKRAILLKNKTLTEFTLKADMPYGTLQQYLSGKRKLNTDVLFEMITHLDVNMNWLFTGEGPMYCHQLKEQIKDQKTERKEINEDRVDSGTDNSPSLDGVFDTFKNRWDKLSDKQKKVLTVMAEEMTEKNEMKGFVSKLRATLSESSSAS